MEALWVALAIAFAAGEPSGMKVLGGPTEQACKEARDAEFADAAAKGLSIDIGECWAPRPEGKPGPKFKKERDS